MKGISSKQFLEEVTSYIPGRMLKEYNTDDEIKEIELKLEHTFSENFKGIYKYLNDKTNIIMGFSSITSDDILFISEQAKKINDEVISNLLVINEGYIKDEYWNNGRIPFAQDGNGSYIMLDLEPGEKGRVGQIIGFDSDYDKVFVISDSIEEFLELILEQFKIGNLNYSNIEGEDTIKWKHGHFFDDCLNIISVNIDS